MSDTPEQQMRVRVERIKNTLGSCLLEETREEVLAEEAGTPSELTWRGNPVRYSKEDDCWEFTEKFTEPTYTFS